MSTGADTALAKLLKAVDNTDPTAEQILDAALGQFEQFGFRRTSMGDVAKSAKLVRSTVYRYFDSKDALIGAVIFRELRRFLKQFGAATEPADSIEDAAAEGFVTVLSFVRTSPVLGPLLKIESEVLLPYLTVDGGPILAFARTYLADRLRNVGDTDVNADLEPLAETLVRLAMSFVLLGDSCIDLDDEESVRGYARKYLAPIAAQSTAVKEPRSK